MSGDDDLVIIRGGKGTGYVAEYEGKTITLTGWRLALIKLVARWIYAQ